MTQSGNRLPRRAVRLLCGAVICSMAYLADAHAQPRVFPINIPSFDGFVLHGTYYDPGHTGPGIAMLHQCNRRGDDTGFESIAPKLADRGFHVVTYDSRGFGQSRSDRYPDYRSMMDEIDELVESDAESVIQFLESLESVDAGSIGTVAASCGTWKVLPIAGRRPELRALVFLSGVYMGVPKAEEALPAVAERPIFVVFAEDDGYGTPESMRGLFANSTHPDSRAVVLKGGAHGTALFGPFPDLEEQISDWLRDRLYLAASD